MCLVIVDLNVAPRVLLTPNDPDYKGLHKAIFGKTQPNAILVYGGHLTEEYGQNALLRRVLVELDRRKLSSEMRQSASEICESPS